MEISPAPIGDLTMTENLGQIAAAAAEKSFATSDSAEQRSDQLWLLRLTRGSHSSRVDGPTWKPPEAGCPGAP